MQLGIKIKKLKTKNKEKLSMMGIDESILNQFININLYDMRKMTIIHSDIQKDNIINKNTDYFLIDWDQSTYGDIGYEYYLKLNIGKLKDDIRNIINM